MIAQEHITLVALQVAVVSPYHPFLLTIITMALPPMATPPIPADTSKIHTELLQDNIEMTGVISKIMAGVVRKTWLSLNLLPGKEQPLHAGIADEER